MPKAIMEKIKTLLLFLFITATLYIPLYLTIGFILSNLFPLRFCHRPVYPGSLKLGASMCIWILGRPLPELFEHVYLIIWIFGPLVVSTLIIRFIFKKLKKRN